MPQVNPYATKTNIINLTPHTLNLYKSYIENNGSVGYFKVAEIESSGVARVTETREEVEGIAIDDVTLEAKLNDTNLIRCFKTTFGETTGLPAEKSGTLYFVSLLVKQTNPQRTDLLSPGTFLRCDKKGNYNLCFGDIIGIIDFNK